MIRMFHTNATENTEMKSKAPPAIIIRGSIRSGVICGGSGDDAITAV